MKKIIIFCFLAISIFSYSGVQEVVKNNQGKNIILMTDHTWVYEEQYSSVESFNGQVKLSDITMTSKRNDGRTLKGTISNQSRNNLEYVTYNVMWKVKGLYTIVETFTIKNLKPRESREFKI